MLIARIESLAAGSTVIISTYQRQPPENAVKDFLAPAGKPCCLAAFALAVRLTAIGMVGVQTLFDGTSGEAEHLPAHGRFERFQIDLFQSLTSEERLDVPQDLTGQQAVERGFF